MKSVSILLATFTLLGCSESAISTTTKRSSESPERSPCAGATIETPCRISIYRLLAIPEKYSGQAVSLRGFLSRGTHGSVMLFPSREASEYSLRDDAIVLSMSADALDLPPDDPIDLYVQITGKFKKGSELATNVLDGEKDTVGHIDVAKARLVAGDAWSCAKVQADKIDAHYMRSNPCEFKRALEKAATQ